MVPILIKRCSRPLCIQSTNTKSDRAKIIAASISSAMRSHSIGCGTVAKSRVSVSPPGNQNRAEELQNRAELSLRESDK
jgi:hypothetical protein